MPADVQALKAQLQGHSGVQAVPYVGRVDILAALAWLLKCDGAGLPRPGQGPAGTVNKAQTAANMSMNGESEIFDLLTPPGCALTASQLHCPSWTRC